jgi:A/G-specific adenine glycosylase
LGVKNSMPKSHVFRFKPAEFQSKALGWYEKNQRVLPWRVRGNKKTDPYKVWLSEIMLQQTTVAAVIPYFLKFLEKWPDVTSLANANDSEVMVAWAGLGYYARARNLLKCARVITNDYKGQFPDTAHELKKLPGIGPYTAAAISTIGFGNPATVMDGNIERIVSRIFAIETPLPLGKKDIRQHCDFIFKDLENFNKQEIKSFPQALMDIGSEICTPKASQCHLCPLTNMCQAYKLGGQEKFPVRAPKKPTPLRKGEVFWIQDKSGRIIVEKRSDNRMLGGMIGLPTTDWDLKERKTIVKDYNFKEKLKNLQKIGVVYHVFTHFKLELDVYEVTMPDFKNVLKCFPEYVPYDGNLVDIGFPTLFQKVARFVQKNL